MPTIVRVVIWAVVIYVLYCGLLFLFQRRVMYPRGLVQPIAINSELESKIEKIQIATRHGSMEAWYIPPDAGTVSSTAPAIVMAHGNAELIDGLLYEFGWLSGKGIGLLLVEYPGYGRSEGAPSQQSITDTFLAAYDKLVQRPDINPEKIVLFGRSLGSGPVCDLSGKRPSAAMVILSGFTSARAFAANYLVPAFLIRDAFDNLAAISRYNRPVLIVHGDQDEMIPYAHATRLAGAAKQGTLITYRCNHNNCPPDEMQFRRDLLGFLAKAGIP
ncbi:MAG: alpha/beta hydrolase [Desulfobacterales bacterium]|jgi:fermentation-respiration switch protein FrsA (DUF1100 family)|nr:alpha/beta hydrolase [Desulfobacterales bacterium]